MTGPWPALAALLLTLAGCTPAALLNATLPDGGVTVTRGVAYAPGPGHTLDIYRPAHPAGPLVVFLYGGSWQTGDKGEYRFVALPLARRGAVVVAADYRLYPAVRFPAFLDDCAAAVAWAVGHAAALGADPDAVFVVGHSAGAYNALMLALDPGYLARAGTSRDRLAGVVGLAGPYDFLPITGADIRAVFAPVQDGPASQPVSYVDGRNPPLLLLAGSDDTTVLPRNTLRLAAKVRAAGGAAEDRLYPGIGHVGLVTAFAPVFSWRAPVLGDVWAFVAAHRRHAATPPPS
jgi:acetyl esterase/lipase